MKAYPDDVRDHLARLHDERRRRYACRAQTPEEFARWQEPARAAFLTLLGIDRIRQDCAGHKTEARVDPEQTDMGAYVRLRGWIETEPNVRMQFWMLRPKGPGPFPLAITPHGHENGDTYVGIARTDAQREKIASQDQAVAVQAAERGFLTLATATRGMGSNPASFRIADITDRCGGRDCHSHNWHAIGFGRSALGERVWDLMRLMDWALGLPDVRRGLVLMTGNSGGGVATLHTAAADPRVTVAVPCCAYDGYLSAFGALRHCHCNVIPGMLEFGEYWDVAGLIAPRRLLTVNGRNDPSHPIEEVDRAVSRLKDIYRAAGAESRYEHRYGDGGHRFFASLMWPWIAAAAKAIEAG